MFGWLKKRFFEDREEQQRTISISFSPEEEVWQADYDRQGRVTKVYIAPTHADIDQHRLSASAETKCIAIEHNVKVEFPFGIKSIMVKTFTMYQDSTMKRCVYSFRY